MMENETEDVELERNLQRSGSSHHSNFVAPAVAKSCFAKLRERRYIVLCVIAFILGFVLGLLIRRCTRVVAADIGAQKGNTTTMETTVSHCNASALRNSSTTGNAEDSAQEIYFCDGSNIKGRGACGTKGAVATSNPLASEAGIAALKAGGNIYDAAIAIQSVLTVIEPWMSGLGGGAFAMIYNATTGKVHYLDAREEAPSGFSPNMFCVNKRCALDENCNCEEFYGEQPGGVSIGVPGVPHAMHIFDQRSKLDRKSNLQKAIDLSENGFIVSQLFYDAVVKNSQWLKLYNESKFLYLLPPKFEAPRVGPGEGLVNRELAETLRRVGEVGWMDFYTGDIAQDIVRAATTAIAPTLQRASPMTLDDLKNYQSVWREPVSFTYRGKYKLYSTNYPSSGGTTLGMILQMLENISPEDYSAPFHDNLAFLQNFITAQDIAFGERNEYMGDPDFSTIPDWLINKTYAQRLFRDYAKIAEKTEFRSPKGRSDNGTSHFSIIDQEGNILSMTTTVEAEFGSYVTVPGRGFILNNEMTDFAEIAYVIINGTKKIHSNAPEGKKRLRRTALDGANTTLGGKRPMSSMTPTIVFDGLGKPIIAVGGSGGSRIIGSVANALLGMMDFGLYPEPAIAAPRAVSRFFETQVEHGMLKKQSWAFMRNTSSVIGEYCNQLLRNVSQYKLMEYASLQSVLCTRGYNVIRDPLKSLVHGILLDHAARGVTHLYAAGDKRSLGTGLSF